MSGPKSIRARVTNTHLQQIFQLQSEISLKCDELGRLSLSDPNRNIFADCSEFLRSTKRRKQDLLKPISVEYVDELPDKLRPLRDFLASIDAEKQNFRNKERDYQAFLTYENYYAASTQAFQTFKTNVVEYLQTYLEQEFPDVFHQSSQNIAPIAIPLRQESFCWNFRNLFSQKKQAVDQAVEQAKSTVNGVRIQVSNKVLALAKDTMPAPGESIRHTDKGIHTKIQEMRDYIANVDDQPAQQHYQDLLETLVKSDTRKNDAYFYTELFDDIKQAERTRVVKAEFQPLLAELEQTPFHTACTSEKQKVREYGQRLLRSTKIKPYQIEEFHVRLTKLQQHHDEHVQADAEQLAQQNARTFIKSQVVSALQRLQYDVMEDAQVVDFETENEFVFQVPNQTNYIHLRFMADGTFRYNFLIPEFKDDLSIDQINAKIHDMESACRNFKQQLRQLEALGIEIDVVKENPMTENALIRVPQKLQHRIDHHESTKSRRRKEQETKKQLRMS